VVGKPEPVDSRGFGGISWLPRIAAPRRQPRASQITLHQAPEVASKDERCGAAAYYRPFGSGVTLAGQWDARVTCALARDHEGDHVSAPRREHRLPWLPRRWWAYSWPRVARTEPASR